MGHLIATCLPSVARRVWWKFHLEENSAATCFQASLVWGHGRTSSPYSTMTEMVLWAMLKPNIRLLYFSPVAKNRSMIASLHPGLMDFLYHVSYFSILGPTLCNTSLDMAGSILTKFLNDTTSRASLPSLSVNKYLGHHNLILLI